MTPTQRTLQRCRDNGWEADVCERWVPIKNHPGGGVRKDLFGFIDVLVLGDDETLAIQATSGSNGNARVIKITTECRKQAISWIRNGNKIQVWAWRKLKKKVDGKTWQPRITDVTLASFEDLK